MDKTFQMILEMRKKQLDVQEQEVDTMKEKKTSPVTKKKTKEQEKSVKIKKTSSNCAKIPSKKLKLSAEAEINDEGADLNSPTKLDNKMNGQAEPNTTAEIQNKPDKKGNKKKVTTKSKKITVTNKPKTVVKSTKQQDKLATKKITQNKKMSSPTKKNLNSNSLINHDIEIKEEPPDSNEDSDQSEPETSHSVHEGRNLFAWLIHPLKTDAFFENTWEKKPTHVKRKKSTYYENVLSTQQIDEILRTQRLEFTKNVDITTYTDGQRETHNPIGRAFPPIVWDFYSNGCSVRLLNPQSFCHKVHLLCATLQEFFGCMVGANSYLTPPGSQGFAPHYDDIEAFVIQIEGKKHWKLYSPRNPSEVLPRTSSPNFSRDEIGEPVLDVILNSGDLLYFPRGTIHEACTLPDEHSLHITLSMYQKHSWADLLEKLIPTMVSRAISENPIFREGLPLDISNHLGLVHSDRKSIRRDQILTGLHELINKTLEYAPFDAAVDQVFKDFQHSALPPILSEQEISCTVFGDGERIISGAEVGNRVEMTPDTKVRLLRANIVRMLMEEEVIRLYYYLDNTTEYQAVEPQFLEVEEAQAPAIEYLILRYPDYVTISSIPSLSDGDKVSLVQTLWERGILITSKPLDVFD